MPMQETPETSTKPRRQRNYLLAAIATPFVLTGLYWWVARSESLAF
jgi:hypothetical protein